MRCKHAMLERTSLTHETDIFVHKKQTKTALMF